MNKIRVQELNLPPLQNLTKRQSQIIDAKLAGIPLPTELMNRAYAEAKRQAKNDPKNPAVTKKAVNLIAMHMVFGEK